MPDEKTTEKIDNPTPETESAKQEPTEDDVLLHIEHLSQHFGSLKAVDDVSFDIKRGEVFGLVGESGCGKTTTGRSIIKLYDITSGSVYFKGQRICAGTRSYKDAIKAAKAAYRADAAALKQQQEDGTLTEEEYQVALAEKCAAMEEEVAVQKEQIRLAKDDQKNCEKKYLHQLKEEYAAALAEVDGDETRLTDEQQSRFKSISRLPKIPKIVWTVTWIVLFALAVTFLVCAIAFGVSFHRQFGNYSGVLSVVDAIDPEAGTTTVTYTVMGKDKQEVSYTAVLAYYDPELNVSTEEQTVRLRIYINEDKPEETALEMPHSAKSTVFTVLCVVMALGGVVVMAYCHERYSSSRLITKIQMIFQDPIASLDPRMTVRDIIAEGLVIQGVKDKEYIDKKVFEVLETVGLVPEHAGRYPHEFSGGQRQRIGVARAVIMNPELIIADEPVSALDVSVQAQVINLLDDLRHKMGLTILFIAHDLSVVKYFSDRIGVMYYGKMVELATSDELFRHPLHPYTRSLLSAIPLPDPEYEKKRKRITYEPLREHDYTVEKPSMREVAPGHFVWCNTPEEQKYKEELGL
ncbi:MAG: ATP-binding cassette domain-containing protein [Eubacteriales bacterium]